ncbi:nucleoside recognition domain-containing protein [Dysgonomonas massiliensis]|uniref:nucleoside recognition domain-containing protein n=1 Tax=Dysgonomonas massiliensis TaxID=2040292 RepID=UPI000C774EF3|nr:nucleoside recognition domain-containing protein [Dysgonomonas massiliensis]
MALNYIWIGFFLVALVVACAKLIFTGDTQVFSDIINATFTSARSGFEISLGLTGVLALWLGIMRIGEQGGVINTFARIAAPVFGKLFPDIPKGHPVIGRMFMNFSANLLGLDNAATPIGLNVMKELQELNPQKDTASNPMIMFLAINASGLTLIPVTILMYRAQLGAAAPADVFIPILLATLISTLTVIFLVATRQKIQLCNRAILIPFGGIMAFVAGVLLLFVTMDREVVASYATTAANILLLTVICGFILAGVIKKINVYDAFIEGAKDGFKTAVTIIPYLIAILVAIGVFRASGAMDYLIDGIKAVIMLVGIDTAWVDALPTMLMKPLSGSGARGMMVDAMQTYGADSLAGRLSCIVQGTTDTTFYVVALYFGSVAIKNIRYVLSYSLIADFVGLIAAVFLAYIFFG